jgi:hypothetical protein
LTKKGQQSFFVESDKNNFEGRFNIFRPNPSREFRLEPVNLEDLVPQDHLLRKINETIDFSFIAVAQNIKKNALFLSKRGKGFVICLIYHIQFPLSVYFLEHTTPGTFLAKRARGLSSSSAFLLQGKPILHFPLSRNPCAG